MEREIALELAKDAVINARDFCGDEREAAIESLQESGVKVTESVLAEIAQISNASWAHFQKKAGVKSKHIKTGISFSHYKN